MITDTTFRKNIKAYYTEEKCRKMKDDKLKELYNLHTKCHPFLKGYTQFDSKNSCCFFYEDWLNIGCELEFRKIL